MKIDVKVEGGEIVARWLGRMPERITPALIKALNAYVIDLRDHVVTQKLSGQVLKVRTGALRSSFMPVFARRKGGMIWAGVGTNVKYARIHELGGTITPKRAKALTVPMPGVRGRAKDYEDTFIAKGMIFQRQEKGIEALFALKKSVTMPSRPYIVPSIEETAPLLEAALDKAINETISKG